MYSRQSAPGVSANAASDVMYTACTRSSAPCASADRWRKAARSAHALFFRTQASSLWPTVKRSNRPPSTPKTTTAVTRKHDWEGLRRRRSRCACETASQCASSSAGASQAPVHSRHSTHCSTAEWIERRRSSERRSVPETVPKRKAVSSRVVARTSTSMSGNGCRVSRDAA
eukprot:scaffold4872_cov116-Isochrysis_galbana.AAC.3